MPEDKDEQRRIAEAATQKLTKAKTLRKEADILEAQMAHFLDLPLV